MRSLRRARVAILSSLLVLVAACGSTTPVATGANDDPADDGAATARSAGDCDSAAAASALAPGADFDHEPAESPADLAASSEVVFRVGEMASIEVDNEWSTITVDQVEIVFDSRDNPAPITKFVALGAGTEERADLDPAALSRMTALVFANTAPGVAGELSATIEGLWLQCPGERPVSVVAAPLGEAWHEAAHSLDAIVKATDGELPVGDVAIRSDQGDGWRLVDTEPGHGHPHEVAFMTSDRALDRAAEARWFATRPQPSFDNEVVIVLAPSVSGSCPAIIFEGLTITDSRVYGDFKPGPSPTGSNTCTDDANPVAFVFLVERRILPETFTLSVEEEVVCNGCEHAQIDVDLANQAELEANLWGRSALDIIIDGTAPADGTANVFRWAPEAALLLPATVFVDLPRWIQGFDSSEARTIEGFVVDCSAGDCPEECDDRSCQNLQPLGDVCAYDYEPETFVDRTVIITWDGVDCDITSVPERAAR